MSLYLTCKDIKIYIYFICYSVPRNKAPSTEAVVFMVGGGNYIEYTNLQDYAKVSISSIRIVAQMIPASNTGMETLRYCSNLAYGQNIYLV